MQFMVNANRAIRVIGIPLILIAYLVFLCFDYFCRPDQNRGHIVEFHKSNLAKEIDDIEGVILGGSNAFFSISAQLMSQVTGVKWYNASLLNEAFTDENYNDFLQDAFRDEKRRKIKQIVYSPVYQYRQGLIKERSLKPRDFRGITPITLKPSRSILDYLEKGVPANQKLYPLPLSNGDFDFLNFECEKKQRYKIDFERENISISSAWIAGNLVNFFNLFKNSTVILVLPSEYYGETSNLKKSEAYANELFIQINEKLTSLQQGFDKKVTYILQPSFPSINYICKVKHHANDQGRYWRTLNLLFAMDLEPQEDVPYAFISGSYKNPRKM